MNELSSLQTDCIFINLMLSGDPNAKVRLAARHMIAKLEAVEQYKAWIEKESGIKRKTIIRPFCMQDTFARATHSA